LQVVEGHLAVHLEQSNCHNDDARSSDRIWAFFARFLARAQSPSRLASCASARNPFILETMSDCAGNNFLPRVIVRFRSVMAMLSETCCFAAAASCGLNSGTSPVAASTASVGDGEFARGRTGTDLAPKIFPLFEGGSIRISGARSSPGEGSPCATGGFGRTTIAVAHGNACTFRPAQPLNVKTAAQHNATCVARRPRRSVPKDILTQVAVVIRQPVAIRFETSCPVRPPI